MIGSLQLCTQLCSQRPHCCSMHQKTAKLCCCMQKSNVYCTFTTICSLLRANTAHLKGNRLNSLANSVPAAAVRQRKKCSANGHDVLYHIHMRLSPPAVFSIPAALRQCYVPCNLHTCPSRHQLYIFNSCCQESVPPPPPSFPGSMFAILANPSRVLAAVCCMLKLRPPGLKSMVGCCGQQTR